MYAITATRTHTSEGWTSTSQVPTFYLHENVQGIVDIGHAVWIANDILMSGVFDSLTTFNITATKIEG